MKYGRRAAIIAAAAVSVAVVASVCFLYLRGGGDNLETLAIREVKMDPDEPVANSSFRIDAVVTGVASDQKVVLLTEWYDGDALASTGWALMVGHGSEYYQTSWINDYERGYEVRYKVVVLPESAEPNDGSDPIIESDWYSYDIP